MKLIKITTHWMVSILLCISFVNYTNLIRNELSAPSNVNHIKIVAGEPQQYIEGIQINGKYITSDDFSLNDWYVANVDVLTEFFISHSLGDTINIEYNNNIKSLAFEYNVTPNPNKIEIFIDNNLFKTIDTSKGNGDKNIVFLPLSQEIYITKDNVIWYLHLIVFGIGILIFIIKELTWKLSWKQIASLLILLLIQHIIVSLTFSLFYTDYLILFNSSFSENNLSELLKLFTLLTFASITAFNRCINKSWKKINYSLSIIGYCVLPYLSLFIIENTYSQFSPLPEQIIQSNLFIISLIYIILILFTNIRYASLTLLILSLIIGLVNKIMIESRGMPLLYYNLFQIEDGLNVASNIALKLNNKMLQSIVITMLLTVIYSFISYIKLPKLLLINIKFNDRYNIKLLKKLTRISIGLILILLFPFINQKIVENANIPLNRWRMYATYGQFGLPLSLASFYEDSKILKPDGYSNSKLQEIINQYPPETNKQTIKPNIIFIQNESQTDFSYFSNVMLEPDPLFYQHSLIENTIHGTLNVAVYGGGTANTEYEVLTNNSINLLSSNIFPYQQIINKNRPSIASYLKGQNYNTVALHPQSGTNYNRKIVYPLLGFDEAYFMDSDPAIDSLAELTFDRSWPSDSFLFNGIKELYSNKDDKPLFSFVVTMQGHGGYLTSEYNYPREVNINGVASDYLAETEFLTSMKKTDEAFHDLITFFQSYHEPTIIVMYGDHQPALSQEFYSQLIDEDDISSKYITPFIVWANFDLPKKNNIRISPNFLTSYVMEILSESEYALPRTSYQLFLSDIQQEVPIITNWGYLDRNGQPIEDIENLSIYQNYLQLEYNNAIDKKPLLDLFE